MQFKQEYKDRKEDFDRDEYRTPSWVFDPLNDVFNFKLDAAAAKENTLAPKYYTKAEDALTCDWLSPSFCNPPYSSGSYGPFLEHAADQWVMRDVESCLLVPATLETKHYDPVWEFARYLIIPRKRISYLLPDGTVAKGNSFLSAVVVFTDRTFYDNSYEMSRLVEVGRVIDMNCVYR